MYSQDVADRICARLAEGESLRSAAVAEGTTHPSFLRWCNDVPALADQYARAMLTRADVKFEELDEVSEDAVNADSAVRIAGLRLKADNIKWQLGKMSPKKYGDKIEHDHKGGINLTLSSTENDL